MRGLGVAILVGLAGTASAAGVSGCERTAPAASTATSTAASTQDPARHAPAPADPPAPPAPAPPAPDVEPQHLDAIDLGVGSVRVKAEVARTRGERQRGLMGRRDLAGTDTGMLFVFPDVSIRTFWMRGTPSPLTIAFLEDDGTIIECLDMQPFDETTVHSTRPSRLALEMAQGWFAARGVKPGDRFVGIERAGRAID